MERKERSNLHGAVQNVAFSTFGCPFSCFNIFDHDNLGDLHLGKPRYNVKEGTRLFVF